MENSGRLEKWGIEIGEHDISYRPRTLIQGQVLADFLAKVPGERTNQLEEIVTTKDEVTAEVWKLFTNGSSNKGGSGARLILSSLKGIEFTYALRFEFNASNNEAEYKTLLVELTIAESIGFKHIDGANRYSARATGAAPGIKSIWNSTGRVGGRPG
ncbi:hypothetical protein Tco_1207752, partial [Tanacetum coccineum]